MRNHQGSAILLAGLVVAASSLLPARASAQVEEIRGLSFDLEIDLEIQGDVLGQTLKSVLPAATLEALPHTFDILPDPAAPFDPGHVLIRTRLPTGPDGPDEMRFELTGTWDALTGALHAEGVAGGYHTWQTPFVDDAFGLLDDEASIWLLVRDPKLVVDLATVPLVPVGDGQIMGFEVIGGQPLLPQSIAATLVMDSALVSWVPLGNVEGFAGPLGPLPLDEPIAVVHHLIADIRSIIGDFNGDAQLTQKDVIAIHKLLGPVTEANLAADLTADGQVDDAEVGMLEDLVRILGHADCSGTIGTGVKLKEGKPNFAQTKF